MRHVNHVFICADAVAPAFQRLHDYIASTYLPACRENIAATSLPNGTAAYAYHVRWQTTTNLTPRQIHEIGLGEVKRIRAEMDKVIASSGFHGSFHEFTEFLRTDPRFYYEQPDDLVNGYRIIAKRIDPGLAHLFGKLPRLPYGVCPIPDFKAPSQTTAYYQPGSPAGKKRSWKQSWPCQWPAVHPRSVRRSRKKPGGLSNQAGIGKACRKVVMSLESPLRKRLPW